MPKISRTAFAERRQHILDAARRCFAESGTKISVEEVCQTAGVSKGAFYGYFKSKDALVEAIAEAHGDMLRGLPALETRDALAAMLLDRTSANDPHFAKVELDTWAYAMHKPHLRAILQENSARLRNILAQTLTGSRLPDERTASLVDFALGGMFIAIALNGQSSTNDVKMAIDDLLQILLD